MFNAFGVDVAGFLAALLRDFLFAFFVVSMMLAEALINGGEEMPSDRLLGGESTVEGVTSGPNFKGDTDAGVEFVTCVFFCFVCLNTC